MNAIQTSGNCNRNVTSDPYAGVAADEVEDVRPYCELVRQFITLHPEFSFLPRKFKIAISGAAEDRAAIGVHDIGLRLHLNEAGQAGFRILVGGGLGRTPFVAKVVREFLPKEDLLAYVHAILRVYNLEGRRDDLYKSRIKILVHDLGVDKFRQLVEEEFELAKSEEDFADRAELERLSNFFPRPAYETLPEKAPELEEAKADPDLALWVKRNVAAHKQAGYAIVNISLKPIGRPPGDASADQMDAIADLAENYSLGTLRVTHRQNLVLGDVRKKDLAELWKKLADLELASPNIERLGDIISCPGLDYCNLATARSIPVAERLSEHFDETNGAGDLGDLRLNISGCINACGHHHVGHIGLLGVEKLGEEFYQITLGGSSASDASIGEIVGPAVPTGKVVDAVENLLQTYKQERKDDERFLDTYRRIGAQPFKERLYADH
jgi:sulfite reductase (NADPH) hemoprotein beta-component